MLRHRLHCTIVRGTCSSGCREGVAAGEDDGGDLSRRNSLQHEVCFGGAPCCPPRHDCATLCGAMLEAGSRRVCAPCCRTVAPFDTGDWPSLIATAGLHASDIYIHDPL